MSGRPLDDIWRRLRADDAGSLAAARATYRVDFPSGPIGMVGEDDDYFYVPVILVTRAGEDTLREDKVTFALGDERVFTLTPGADFPPFDRALTRLRRFPEYGQEPKGVLRALLEAMNEASEEVIWVASAALEVLNREIEGITLDAEGEGGRVFSAADINETMAALNEQETLISRCQENQLMLARAARYLRVEVSASSRDLRTQVDTLLSDIDSVKQHASFEHDKVRYLQQSLMNSLTVKQNQIVKVFTIITAVFLPPTLVATFYGMNFAVMPELAWTHGFTAAVFMTLLAAVLPLLYIRRKGWLR